MRLQIEQRYANGTVVLECAGRIILGAEVEKLLSVVSGLVADRCNVVIHLGKVTHIDSNGLGTLLKMVSTARAAGTSLVFCNPTPHVQNLFQITQLYTAMDIYESEQAALAAGGRPQAAAAAPARGRTVLCVEPSADMLVFFTGVLKTAGYEVLGVRHYLDGITLLKAGRTDAVVFGPGTAGLRSTDAEQEFRRLVAGKPQVKLEESFAAAEASESSTLLMQQLQEALA